MLELQSALPGAFGHRLHAAVILIAAAIEDDLRDAGRLGAFGDSFPDFGRFLGLLFRLDVQIADGGDRMTLRVVDELSVDVFERAEDHEPRTLVRAGDLLA